MEIEQVAPGVSEEKLSIFMRKKTFLVKYIQAKLKQSNGIQACQVIPTNPNLMSWFFSEISGNFHPRFMVSHQPGSLGYPKLFSDLAAWIPLQGKLLEKLQLLHSQGGLGLCFKPEKPEL